MPYRRLPNTDQARMRAIEAALEKGKRVPIKDLAFSYLSLEKLQSIYPRLSGAIRQLNAAKQNQFDKSREYGEIFKKSKLYLTHFIQVMSFAIIREEMKPDVRKYYGLDPNTQRLPALNLEKDVLEWGEKIIKGEQQRCMQGGSPIYSPSIALVKVHFESFIEAYRHQKMLQNITNRASDQMNQIRDEADKLIQEVWNEVEEKFALLPDDVKRDKAANYGVTYVYRPSELKKMEADKLQTNLF
ncbi:hypothetical protein [Mangrovibacterium diazotrophicum]|uniref:Uncharacterized protein n=1 Tax=Mangrovibacterium diazotrophicum TaxID=1261403 RepID=A0A419W9F1_9BACT|nr:hypothetical protein [Mangrovibacterium diazotrophicum]RKD92093.1 hypothetical protein BC643_2463 [Mangrovibacterium diazotrophicum]